MSAGSKEKKNIVFFGYREWAAGIAKRLVDVSYCRSGGWHLAQYWTINVGGHYPWWKEIEASPEKKKILPKICYCGDRSPDRLEKLSHEIWDIKPLAILAYGWSWMIPPSILAIAPTIILHPSPLPRYRGGSPIQHQILAGETESAATLLWATDQTDAGPILAQKKFSLAGDLNSIFKSIEEIGVELTIPILDLLAAGANLPGTPQDEAAATTFKRRTPADSEIGATEILTKPASYFANKVRCLQPPYPEAFITCGDGKRLVIEKARIEG